MAAATAYGGEATIEAMRWQLRRRRPGRRAHTVCSASPARPPRECLLSTGSTRPPRCLLWRCCGTHTCVTRTNGRLRVIPRLVPAERETSVVMNSVTMKSPMRMVVSSTPTAASVMPRDARYNSSTTVTPPKDASRATRVRNSSCTSRLLNTSRSMAFEPAGPGTMEIRCRDGQRNARRARHDRRAPPSGK